MTITPFAVRPQIGLYWDCIRQMQAKRFETNRMNISLELTGETAERIARAATSAGQDVSWFVKAFVQQSFSSEGAPRRSVAEILAPFRAEVEQSGLSDRELDGLFTEAREGASLRRREQRG